MKTFEIHTKHYTREVIAGSLKQAVNKFLVEQAPTTNEILGIIELNKGLRVERNG